MNEPFEQIRLDVADAIATITLNRPERLNSFTAQMHVELRRAISAVRDDPLIRVLILTGAGRAFCAGQDLGERKLAKGGPRPDLGADAQGRAGPSVSTEGTSAGVGSRKTCQAGATVPYPAVRGLVVGSRR